jgi:hypothetical protein
VKLMLPVTVLADSFTVPGNVRASQTQRAVCRSPALSVNVPDIVMGEPTA